MKKVLLSTFAAFIILTGCMESGSQVATQETPGDNPMAIPALYERSGELATALEWSKTKEKVAELNARILKNPRDVKPRLQLASIYLAEARITGEHPYYYPVIEKVLNGVLLIDPKNFEATVFKASVKLSQHRFTEARDLAEKARALHADNAYVYGLLVDAHVELGEYEEAVAMSDKMQSIKPSLESYSRASYLREIYGDFKGAIEAMQLAVQAGLPGSEPQCWSRNVLGQLYLNTGDLNKAEQAFRVNLAMRPSYAFSFAGLAKVAEKRKQYDKALQLLDSAAAIMPEFSFHESMGDIYALKGDAAKAGQKYAQVKEMLLEDAQSGHTVALDMSKLFTKMAQWDSAKVYALQEYTVRPKNIDVNKELAWIAFHQNDKAAAQKYLAVAMRTGSKDPELLERAASIRY